MSQTSLFQEDFNYIKSLIEERVPLVKEGRISIPLENTTKEGYSAIYRNGAVTDHLVDTIHPSLRTYYDIWRTAVAIYADKPFLGYRKFDNESNTFEQKYTWETYNTINERAKSIGSGILVVLEDNIHRDSSRLKDGNIIVSLFSPNRLEWVLTDLAASLYSLTTTALYNTLGPDASKHILKLTASPIIVCSKDKIASLLELKEKHSIESLVCIISMDNLNERDKLFIRCREQNVGLYDLNHIEKLGESNLQPIRPPTPADLYTISFTSGTTGSKPKGVMLTHGNCVAGITNTITSIACPKNPVSYSLLPLAHIYERLSVAFTLTHGGRVGFPQSASPTTMVDDLKVLKPTHLSVVPRIYTKLEAALKDKIYNSGSTIKVALINHIIKTKTSTLAKNEGVRPTHTIYDNTIIKSIKKQIGFDNVSDCITGSAPISNATVNFLRSLLNVGICQGYGLTESFAGISVSGLYEVSPDSCGPVGVTCEMKTKDVPEMGYTSKDAGGPRGEIMLRGPQIFQGYYKDENETSKAIDTEGWFHTGDIGRIDENGRLYIIDRLKNFFKLAQGEYVTPERIENQYLSACPLINQIYIHGESLETYLVAVVGVDQQMIVSFLKKELNISDDALNNNEKLIELLNSKKVKKHLLKHMNHSIEPFGLHGFEKLHNIELDIDPLTIERNIITPTLKIKRPLAFKFFKSVFKKLYEEGSLVYGSKL